MFFYRLLADAALLFHAGYVLFVVLGLPVILLGAWRGWGWVRNFWFRLAHLLCMVIVGFEALAAIPCPLTVLERSLRSLAGQQSYPGEFLAYWAERLLYLNWPQWAFDTLHVSFSLVLLAVFVLVPPRWPRRTAASHIAHSQAT
jgi:hypothetical protein